MALHDEDFLAETRLSVFVQTQQIKVTHWLSHPLPYALPLPVLQVVNKGGEDVGAEILLLLFLPLPLAQHRLCQKSQRRCPPFITGSW